MAGYRVRRKKRTLPKSECQTSALPEFCERDGKIYAFTQRSTTSYWGDLSSMTQDIIPKKFQKMYARAMGGKSKAAAIKFNCIMCMGFRDKDVAGCTAVACPMYPYRPGGKK